MNLQLTPRLEQLQTHGLALNPAMRVSLEVLALPAGALAAYVYEAMSENPFLEAGDGGSWAEGEAFSAMAYGYGLSDGLSEYPPAADAAPRTLAAHLKEQLLDAPAAPDIRKLCRYLIDCLDDRGYMPCPPEELAAALGCPPGKLLAAYELLRTLRPVGVGALNLSDCLAAQLDAAGWRPDIAARLATEGLPFIASGDMRGLARLMGRETEEAARLAEAVRALNPIPAQGFDGGSPLSRMMADACVRLEDGQLRVTVNRGGLPALTLSADYGRLLAVEKDAATLKYLKERRAAAAALLAALREREKTLARLLACLAARQPRYFAEGRALAPLTMAQAAADMGVHVSTVSRAARDKYVICAAGAVPLKALFSAALSPGADGAAFSPMAARERILACIRDEDKRRPLSDESIARALRAARINISRRTVAKYRDALGFPAAVRRKRAFGMKDWVENGSQP